MTSGTAERCDRFPTTEIPAASSSPATTPSEGLYTIGSYPRVFIFLARSAVTISVPVRRDNPMFVYRIITVSRYHFPSSWREITVLLRAWETLDKLIPRVYGESKRLARRYMHSSLQPGFSWPRRVYTQAPPLEPYLSYLVQNCPIGAFTDTRVDVTGYETLRNFAASGVPYDESDLVRILSDIAGYRSGGAQFHYRLISVIWRFADKS